jgi:hypothetical protein
MHRLVEILHLSTDNVWTWHIHTLYRKSEGVAIADTINQERKSGFSLRLIASPLREERIASEL